MATEVLTRRATVTDLNGPGLTVPIKEPIIHNPQPRASAVGRRREKLLKNFAWVSLRPVKSEDSASHSVISQTTVENGAPRVDNGHVLNNISATTAQPHPGTNTPQHQNGVSLSQSTTPVDNGGILSRWKRLRRRDKPQQSVVIVMNHLQTANQALSVNGTNGNGPNTISPLSTAASAPLAQATTTGNTIISSPASPVGELPVDGTSPPAEDSIPIITANTVDPSSISGHVEDTQNSSAPVLESLNSARLYLAEKDIYVANPDEMQPPDSVLGDWYDSILPTLMINLRAAITSLPRTLPRAAKSVEAEICMSGQLTPDGSQVALEPTIWIRCGSPKCREKVQEVGLHLRRIQQLPVHVTLHAPRPAGFRPSDMELNNGADFLPRDTTDEILPIVSNDPNFWTQAIGNSTVRIRVQPHSHDRRSGCGLRCHMSAPNGDTYICTIGGMVMVDDQVFALTTAHALWDTSLYTDESSETSSGSDIHLIYDASHRPIQNLDTMMSGNLQDPSYDESRHYQGWMNAALHAASYKASNHPQMPLGPVNPISGDGFCRDFALLHVEVNEGGSLQNKYRSPAGDNVVNCVSHKLSGRDVGLLGPFGKFKGGRLLDGPSYIIDDTGYWETRKIRLKDGAPLAQGVSGTWVVDGSALIGVIIAVYDNEPFVHMLPIRSVFSAIETVLGTVSKRPKVKLMDYHPMPASPVLSVSSSDRDAGDVISLMVSEEDIQTEIAAGHIKPPSQQSTSRRSTSSSSISSLDEIKPRNVYELLVASWFMVIIIGLNISMFPLILPSITDHFNSVDFAGWYGSVYLLSFGVAFPVMSTFCVSMATYSYRRFLLLLITAGSTVAVIGSLISYLARSESIMLVGRGFSGFGAGTSLFGAFFYQGLLPSARKYRVGIALLLVYAVARFLGPLLVGPIMQSSSIPKWRIPFLIELAFSAAALILSLLFASRHRNNLPRVIPNLLWPTSEQREERGHKDSAKLFVFGAVVCLLLALYFGPTRSWSDALVISLFAAGMGGFVLLAAMRIISMYWVPSFLIKFFPVDLSGHKSSKKRLPLRISEISVTTLWGAAYYTMCHFLPMWLQSTRGATVTQTIYTTLPLAATYLFMIVTGGVVIWGPKISVPGVRVNHFLLLVSLSHMTLSSGLLTRLGPNSAQSMMLGLQTLFAFGAGFGAFQAALPVIYWRDIRFSHSSEEQHEKFFDRMEHLSMFIFAEAIGGAIGIAAGQAVFMSLLREAVNHSRPNLDILLRSGATGFRGKLSGETLEKAIQTYNRALTRTFFVATGAAGLPWGITAAALVLLITPPIICLLWCIRRRKLKKEAPPPPLPVQPPMAPYPPMAAYPPGAMHAPPPPTAYQYSNKGKEKMTDTQVPHPASQASPLFDLYGHQSPPALAQSDYPQQDYIRPYPRSFSGARSREPSR